MQISEYQERQLLNAFTQAPLALGKWFRDGTLVFASDEGFAKLGIDLRAGLAEPYQQQFAHVPALVQAISQAFQGRVVSDTVRIQEKSLDVRFFPAYDSKKTLAGVIGILTDATDRITAFRVVRTMEVLSRIRWHLARSDSTAEFLKKACEAIQELFASVWIGLADHGRHKALNVITGRGAESEYFSSLDLSWDLARPSGRDLAAEAVRTGRTQRSEDISNTPGCEIWERGVRRYGWKSMLAVPLLREGVSVGVLAVHSADPLAFDREVVGLWENIATEITEGIRLLEDREERKQMVLERQEADDKYKQLVETVFDVIVVHRDGKVLEINPAGVQLAGAADHDALIGTPLLALVDPVDRQRVEHLVAANDPTSPARMLEFSLLSLDGRRVDVEGLTVPIRYGRAPAALSVLRDISQRKRHEQAISRATARLEYAQHVAKMGSIEVNLDDGRTEWSKNALAILGLAGPTEPLGVPQAIAQQAIHEDKPLIESLVDDIRRTAKAASTEFRRLSQTGIPKTILIHGIPQVEKSARVSHIFFVVQDISEFRDIERGLKITTERLLRAQSIGRIGDFELRTDTQQIALSSGACRMLGMGDAPATLSLDSFCRQVHPDDQVPLRRTLEGLVAARLDSRQRSAQPVDTDADCCVDCRLVSRAREQWINIQAKYVDDEDGKKVIGNLQDITERKRVEIEIQRAKQQLVDANRLARVWEWQLDLERNILTWSDSVNELLGAKSPISEMTYEQFLATIRDVDREPMQRAVSNTVKHGVPGEVVYVQKFLAGQSVRLFARWVAERNAQGQVVKLLGASLDVTSVREIHEREARDERLHQQTGMPGKSMAYDRVCCLAEQAKRFQRGFSILKIQVLNYRELRAHCGESRFYAAQVEIAESLHRHFHELDTYARLDKGRFVLVFRVVLNETDAEAAIGFVRETWAHAMGWDGGAESPRLQSAWAHCPDDGTDWKGLLDLVEYRIEQA